MSLLAYLTTGKLWTEITHPNNRQTGKLYSEITGKLCSEISGKLWCVISNI